MDHRQMAYFLEVCKHRSITAAAGSIHISEQALSKSMQRLEEELQIPLFIRRNKGVELTPFGRELQEEARAYLTHHEYILEHFRSIASQEKPRLVLSVATGVMAQWLPENFLADFITAHPETDFEIYCFFEDSFNRVQQAYDRDLIFCTSHAFPEQWKVALHAQRSIRVLMHKSHPLAEKDTLRTKDLLHQRMAMAIDDTPNQRAIRARLEEAGVRPAMYFGPAEIPLLNRLIEGNQFISLYGGDERLLPDHLTARPIGDMDGYWDFYILRRRKISLPDSATQLLAQVKTALSLA